jgi:hypothetical protein
MTINVPGDQPTLAAALAFLDDFLIGNATVTIRITASATSSVPIVVFHRDGERIKITGATTNPRPTLAFTNTTGIVVRGRLGELSNLVIDGTDPIAGQRGLTLANGSHAFVNNVDVDDFSTGVEVSRGASLAGGSVTANSCATNGFFVFDGGALTAASIVATDNGTNLKIERGGVVTANSITTSGGSFGVSCVGGRAYLFGGSITNVSAFDGCFVDASAPTIGSANPAVNTVGNNQAFIKD